MSKYYAVVKGVTPGVYTDWQTTQKMVKGYSGAIYKSFKSKIEAEEFLNNSTNTAISNDVNRTLIYTDGSCDGTTCGFGVVILTSKGDKITAYGQVPHAVHLARPTNNIAELYAIYVALSLVEVESIIYTDSSYSISCLNSYIHDWMRNGWNGVANRDLIENVYRLFKQRKVTLQHVKAHCGIALNEEADTLANKGRLVDDDLIIHKNGNRWTS